MQTLPVRDRETPCHSNRCSCLAASSQSGCSRSHPADSCWETNTIPPFLLQRAVSVNSVSPWQLDCACEHAGLPCSAALLHMTFRACLDLPCLLPPVSPQQQAGATDFVLLGCVALLLISFKPDMPLPSADDPARDPQSARGGVMVMDMGLHVVPGLPEPQQLQQILPPGLEERARHVPPLRTTRQLMPGAFRMTSACSAGCTSHCLRAWSTR